MQEVKELVELAVKKAFGINCESPLDRPEEKFGDYASNIALQLSKKLSKNPREIAEKIAAELEKNAVIKKVEIAGAGFINITLTDEYLGKAVQEVTASSPNIYKGKVVVVEYSDPNPFKVLHAGHLYQTVFGDSISRLVGRAGGEVHDVNFGGDVGRHVAITMWAILKELGGEKPEKLTDIPEDDRSNWLAKCYVDGNNAFEDDPQVKSEVLSLNKRVYKIHNDDDHDSPFAKIYWTTRQWSYDYFEQFYASIGSGFEKYYPESITAPVGLKTVKEQLKKGIYEESDGAIVFRGEPYGLHTRVFINSEGLPTYEAKDIGLAIVKWEDYHFDQTIIITGNDITEYMKVVLKSLEQFRPEIAERTKHFTHGQVKLKGGVKMSSRKGNIVKAADILETAREASKKIIGSSNEDTVLAAVKFAFLKQRLGPDVVYEPEESVSLQGNSGPYLQYSHARACSVLAKVKNVESTEHNFEPGERTLARKLSEYPEVVAAATDDLMPHHIANYLYELAQEFNRFYEKNRVIGDSREGIRASLVRRYVDVLKDGLSLLNISAPEKM